MPIQCIRALNAKAINIVKGRSQLDVCGAPTKTNLGIAGSNPSVRHPINDRTKRAAPGNMDSRTGVLKIVYFTAIYR